MVMSFFFSYVKRGYEKEEKWSILEGLKKKKRKTKWCEDQKREKKKKIIK